MVGKSPLRCIQLMGGYTDIQQDAVHPIDAQIRQHPIHMHEIGAHQRGGQPRQPLSGGLNGIGILIQ